MKTFKHIDLYIQIALIISLTIASLINHDSTFLVAYFVVGTWQAISMVVHQYNKWHIRKEGRRYYYQRIVVCTLLLMAFAFLIPYLFIFWYLLLFTAPFLAIYYTAICYREVFYPAKRPLELI